MIPPKADKRVPPGSVWVASMAAVFLSAAASCSSRDSLGDVRGSVAVDGQPADIGTISFRPAATSGASGAGAAINGGEFQLSAEHGLSPGQYSVAVQASKKTGRMFDHPQRGKVPVLVQLDLADSPKDVELTAENAGKLLLEFTTARK